MDTTLVKQLAQTRDILREKLRSLKRDIEASKQQLDIQYAPLREPLQQIVSKLEDVRIVPMKYKEEEIDEKSFLSPPEMKASTPFIIKRRPSSKLRSRIFHKKYRTFKTTPASSITPHVSAKLTDVKPKPKRSSIKLQSFFASTPTRRTSTSPITQPSFLELEEVGELIPTPIEPIEPTEKTRYEEEELIETDEDESLDLEKAESHARSLMQERKEILETSLQVPEIQEALSKFHHLPRQYLHDMQTDVERAFDSKYGVRETDGGLYIGTAEVSFDGPNIVIDNMHYKGTKGLYELLFKKDPGKFSYSDVRDYRDILRRTNAYRVQYDPKNPIAGNRGTKYVKIIKPILQGKPPEVWWARSWKVGGFINKEVVPNSRLLYQYWDDPNELIDRLRLLLASQAAGHTGHNNEIVSIIEELREAKIIE